MHHNSAYLFISCGTWQNEHYKDKLDSENSLYKNFVKKHLILSSVHLVAI